MTRDEAREVLERVKEFTKLPFKTGDAIAVAIDALKADEEKPKRWKPILKQTYYVEGGGVVYTHTWMDDTTDARLRERRKIFPTEEEAKYAAECELVAAELQNYADEHNEHEIVWDGDNIYFNLYYTHAGEEIGISTCSVIQYKDVYFTSAEIAKDAVEAIGEERLKKYYFKVGG